MLAGDFAGIRLRSDVRHLALHLWYAEHPPRIGSQFAIAKKRFLASCKYHRYYAAFVLRAPTRISKKSGADGALIISKN
ncbi:hypothetical protein QUB63_21235 [Microcoleus sp. ARI1-B5]|uniref:hypothetical protein n=1 Tax=unclassified Microcoleus TaxID=2642155 RepID=UPI002FD56744